MTDPVNRPGVTSSNVTWEEAQGIARLFDALGNEHRVLSLHYACRNPHGLQVQNEMTQLLRLGQATTSFHLAKLLREGLVKYDIDGNSHPYTAIASMRPKLHEAIDAIYDIRLLTKAEELKLRLKTLIENLKDQEVIKTLDNESIELLLLLHEQIEASV